MGHPALPAIRSKVCCLSPLKSIAMAGFEPETFESSGKHTNHYTTKASIEGIQSSDMLTRASHLQRVNAV
jgi:hypothetical protein